MTKFIPTDRELEILKVLWRQENATVQVIRDTLEEDGVKLAYTTVLTVLQVMERKQLVGHGKTGKAYTYFPKLQRDKTFRQLAGGFLDKVFNGAMEEYLLHALESRRLSAKQFDRLEKMIGEVKARSKRKPKKRGRK